MADSLRTEVRGERSLSARSISMKRAGISGGMGHLVDDEGKLLETGESHAALNSAKWIGQEVCRVHLSDDYDAEEWNMVITPKNICFYSDDKENCKLIPRRMIQMIDLVDTDEVVVKVSKRSYYCKKICLTLAAYLCLGALGYGYFVISDPDYLSGKLPADMVSALSPFLNKWFTLFVVLFAPFVWYLVGCCVAKPHSQVFKGSKVHIMTGKVTTTLWMADEDIPNIQELIDDPYDESAV